jgi:hypothetical protein
MHTYPLTQKISYRVKCAREFKAQTAQAYLNGSELLYEGHAYAPADLLRLLDHNERLELADRVLSQSIRQSLLLGLLPYRVMLDPEATLIEAARVGIMLFGDNIVVACFSRAIQKAQDLALFIDPGQMRAICNLFMHPLIAGQLALKMAHPNAQSFLVEDLANSNSHPLVLPALYKDMLDPMVESCTPSIRNIHAACFSDPQRAIAQGAHFDPHAFGLLGSSVAATEGAALDVGYSWRTLGVLPLLPPSVQPEFLLSLVAELHEIKRGHKQLSAALTSEPEAFRSALRRLDPLACQRLISKGVLGHQHLEIVSEVARSMLLESDLGL